IAELAGPGTADLSLSLWRRDDGIPLGIETVPGQDVGEDGELTARLAADMISALRSGDGGRADDAGRRMAHLPLPHLVTLTRQVAHTAGVLVGQVRAQKADVSSP